MVGPKSDWYKTGSPLSFVRQVLVDHGTRIYHAETQDAFQTSLSQISRLFVANIPEIFPNLDQDLSDSSYLLTSDADILPIGDIYDLPHPKFQIHITNAAMLNPFTFNGTRYPQYPMTTIGMRLGAWHEVMQYSRYGSINANTSFSDSVMRVIEAEFGFQQNGTIKGDANWFLDQQLISIKLARWLASNKLHPGRINVLCGFPKRWDRSAFPIGLSREGWLSGTDVHGPLPPHTETAFRKLEPIATILTEQFDFNVTSYWQKFLNLTREAIRSPKKRKEKVVALKLMAG